MFQYRLLEGVLQRLYGSRVELIYRQATGCAFGGKLPMVVINGTVITEGGLPPRQAIEHLKRLDGPRQTGN
ncbi:hypothetical protein GFC01_04975 [Desulfofundulus thermobenzoicus]|uniref:Thioredoxin-like fold domain-containing protein n=1 Tax=Desulfofundulus thermobenzoicus TaxID=29376 RepID=A0A6N7INN8_9FIRM|nr:hypothetical protein [Desulfofundulus thermobenzoicus]MQL51622.1 hypothetical protein [Desulfofundulus thermobenzoicus]